MGKFPPEYAIFISAELFFVLFQSKNLLIWAKHGTQRSEFEQKQIDNGLVRSILLEMFVFVPTSALLMLMISPVFNFAKSRAGTDFAFYSILGIVSYGFPFAAIRQYVTRIALKALQEFANIIRESDSETQTPESE